MGSSGCANISAPTLGEVREGWGTPCVVYGSEIKGLGHPPGSEFDEYSRGLERNRMSLGAD